MPYRCIAFNGKYIRQKKEGGKWKKVAVHDSLEKCKSAIRAIGWSKHSNFNLSLVGDFGFDFSGFEAAEEVKKLDEKTDPIRIKISSRGGNLEDGIALHNAIRDAKSKVHVYFDGRAQSTALWAVGSADHIVASENTIFLIHAPKFMPGLMQQYSEEQLRSNADALKVARGIIENTLKARAKKEITLEKDTWLTAEQALELGLIDGVAPVYSKMSNMNFSDEMNVPECITNFIAETNKEIETMTLVDVAAKLGISMEEGKEEESLVNFFEAQKKEIEDLKKKLEPEKKVEKLSPAVVNMAIKYRNSEIESLVKEGKLTGAAAKEFKTRYASEDVIQDSGIDDTEFDNVAAILRKNDTIINFDSKTGTQKLPKREEEENAVVADAERRRKEAEARR